MTIRDAVYEQTTPFSTPTIGSTAFLYIGLKNLDNSGLSQIQDNKEITTNEIYGQSYPSLYAGNLPADNIPLKGILVNALPLYWFYGKATGQTTRTITNTDQTTSKPRFCLWVDDDGKYHYYNGVIYNSLSLEFRESALHFGLTGKALSHDETTSAPASFSFPSSVDDPFDVLYSCSWNSGSPVTLKPSQFKLDAVQPMKGIIDSSTKQYKKILQFNMQTTTLTLQFTSTYGELLRTDFYAGTPGEFKIKFVKSTDITKYIEITLSDCYLAGLVKTRVEGKDPIYTIPLTAAAVSIVSPDGVADSYYGTEA